jgi:branched-chain amino acid transport system permease protein
MGGVAGILVGMYYNAIWPTMGYIAGIKAFAAAVLGGIGSVPGAMLGGGILGMAEVMGAGYISSAYRDGIAYAVMILVIIFKPSGLLGKSTLQKV